MIDPATEEPVPESPSDQIREHHAPEAPPMEKNDSPSGRGTGPDIIQPGEPITTEDLGDIIDAVGPDANIVIVNVGELINE